MQQGFLQVNTRLDTQAARLERHAGFWQPAPGGVLAWMPGPKKWNSALEVKDHQIAELRERLGKIEKRTS